MTMDPKRRVLPLQSGLAALIGVTTSELRLAKQVRRRRHGEPARVEMALGLPYLQAVERAGGLPVVLPPLELDRISPLLDRLSGVLLSGGPDLDPGAYGRAAHPELGDTEPQLDVFEVQLAREADARGLPILGICRGAQALNVARGGTLHQHLPEITDGSIAHRQRQPGTEPTHEVRIAPRSRVAAVLGTRRLAVNSFHHQGVDLLGKGLRAVAWADDGVVEAIEGWGKSLLLGVQWHAETLVDNPAQLALFRRLVTVCEERERERPAPRAGPTRRAA
ncbi:MAG: gamma-glutamyl-gamma-aminobutyrate hydrolase family protein [Solirubrobacteraceae bacterium]|nr:MAG: gamma-glutamyl-gamma-aminobutyrate hydrolase [Solirubrobacterales bacterium]